MSESCAAASGHALRSAQSDASGRSGSNRAPATLSRQVIGGVLLGLLVVAGPASIDYTLALAAPYLYTLTLSAPSIEAACTVAVAAVGP